VSSFSSGKCTLVQLAAAVPLRHSLTPLQQ
jgi:hypothetical protein